MNLAKVERRRTSLPQRTFRRETTMPRQATELPDAEINARIVRPNDDGARELQEILGLANTVGQKALKQIQDRADKAAEADAVLDFAAGEKDEKRFARSYAYRDAYQREGAKRLAIDVGTQAKQVVEDLFNDPANPPTMEEVDAAIEGVFRTHTMDPEGNLLDFGTPEAKVILGNALREVKSTLIPTAAEAISKQMDISFMETLVQNQIYERDRGAPIGADIEVVVQPDVDPLAPLPEGEAAPAAPSRVSLGRPTGKPPHPGKVTANMAEHRARGSIGVDIDGRYGDPITAPAGGRATVHHDDRSGLYVQVDHGNGVVSTYSHLAMASVKDGQIIRPGQRLGTMGNSGNVKAGPGGDGSHLHWRVKVNGKDVDPLSYSFADGATGTMLPSGVGPELLTELPPGEAPGSKPGLNIEEAMASLPPSINKTFAKTYWLNAAISEAASRQDPSLLNDLENSTRADGAPSFTPTERKQIVDARDAIRNERRRESDRLERELHDKNRDLVLEAFVQGKDVSPDWLADQGAKGLLDDGFVYTMVNHIESEAEQAAARFTAEAKEAEREANADLDATTYAEEIARREGDLEGVSYEDDLRAFRDGEFGTGKKAAARFKRLRAAARAGQQELERNPEVARFASIIKSTYKPVQFGNGSILMRRRNSNALPAADYAAMMQHYRNRVRAGDDPEDAFHSAVQRYAKKATANIERKKSLNAREAEILRALRGGG